MKIEKVIFLDIDAATPILDYSYEREEEINVFISEHPEIKTYVVLDDQKFSEKISSNFIRIKEYISEEDSKKAIAILNG